MDFVNVLNDATDLAKAKYETLAVTRKGLINIDNVPDVSDDSVQEPPSSSVDGTIEDDTASRGAIEEAIALDGASKSVPEESDNLTGADLDIFETDGEGESQKDTSEGTQSSVTMRGLDSPNKKT